MNQTFSAIVLAAGLGTRMKSDIPKVLHEICGSSLVEHVLKNLEESDIQSIAVITGYKHEMVSQKLGTSYEYYYQERQLGTAHAVMQAKEFLTKNKGRVLVLCGDAPLQDSECLLAFTDYCEKNQLDLGILTARLSDPAGYGRIVRKDGKLQKIVEKKDCSSEEILINEINSGTYCFDSEKLLECLAEIKTDNAQGEYYLTDAVEIFIKKNYRVDAFVSPNPDIIKAANNLYELYECEKTMRENINKKHMINGVRMIDAAATYIDRDVTIEAGTMIYPNTIISGRTKIGKNNTIIASRIDNCEIGDNNEIDTSTLESSTVADDVHIGPYAHLRPNCIIKDRVKIGNFVEVKNSLINEDSKASHLTYIGDGEIGRDVNLGCGIVFVNYDGKHKHKTIIEDGAFIGCNVNLIAPIKIGRNAFVAAGSTISEDVEENALVIARSKSIVKSGWNKK